MIKFPLLLVATLAFLAGTILLWRILLSKNLPGEPSAVISIRESSYAVEVAQTFEQKAKGLAGRESLTPGTGMIFLFDRQSVISFTMQGMRFPLDIIWIASGTIVDISKGLQPDTSIIASAYKPSSPIDMVLELNAGTADRDGLKIGDSVMIDYK